MTNEKGIDMKKPLPRFKSEDFVPVHFPNLKPSTQTISLCLPQNLLANLKVLANKQDIPYQSLMKIFLAERARHELRDQGIKAYKVKKDLDQEKEK